MVRLKDIAEKANVSVSTVSRVLGNRPGTVPISERTSQKVVKVARELGFRPNEAARRLQLRSQWATLALFLPETWGLTADSAFSGYFFRAIFDNLGPHHGLTVVLYEPSDLKASYDSISNVVSGMIIVGPNSYDLQFLSDLSSSVQPPFVVVNRVLESAISIVGDNESGAVAGVNHLVQKGHRRIALISEVDPDSASNIHPRDRGYVRGLRDNVAEHDPSLVFRLPAQLKNEDGERCLQTVVAELLSLPDPPTALFCTRDKFAFAVVRELKRRGMRPPRDMAVVGFDGAEICDLSDPPITSVRLPAEEMGRKAVEIVVGYLAGTVNPENKIVLPCELVIRQTS